MNPGSSNTNGNPERSNNSGMESEDDETPAGENGYNAKSNQPRPGTSSKSNRIANRAEIEENILEDGNGRDPVLDRVALNLVVRETNETTERRDTTEAPSPAIIEEVEQDWNNRNFNSSGTNGGSEGSLQESNSHLKQKMFLLLSDLKTLKNENIALKKTVEDKQLEIEKLTSKLNAKEGEWSKRQMEGEENDDENHKAGPSKRSRMEMEDEVNICSGPGMGGEEIRQHVELQVLEQQEAVREEFLCQNLDNHLIEENEGEEEGAEQDEWEDAVEDNEWDEQVRADNVNEGEQVAEPEDWAEQGAEEQECDEGGVQPEGLEEHVAEEEEEWEEQGVEQEEWAEQVGDEEWGEQGVEQEEWEEGWAEEEWEEEEEPEEEWDEEEEEEADEEEEWEEEEDDYDPGENQYPNNSYIHVSIRM